MRDRDCYLFEIFSQEFCKIEQFAITIPRIVVECDIGYQCSIDHRQCRVIDRRKVVVIQFQHLQ